MQSTTITNSIFAEDKRERLKTELERAKEDDGDEVEREDEQPTVVVLKAGDIGPEEFQAYRQQMKGTPKFKTEQF